MSTTVADVYGRQMSTVALQTDEWRKALANGIVRADSEKTPVPFWVEKELGNGLGKLMLCAVHRLKDARPGNGGLRLWSYADVEAAHTEAQVRSCESS